MVPREGTVRVQGLLSKDAWDEVFPGGDAADRWEP